MTISWITDEGKTGVAEDGYELAMQHSEQSTSQKRLEDSFSQFSEGQQRNFETKLTDEEEPKFQEWKKQYAPKDSGFDYDLRGAFKEGLKPDPTTGHWPDTYKKPNHETFSNESKYAGDAPDRVGSWVGPNHDIYLPPNLTQYNHKKWNWPYGDRSLTHDAEGKSYTDEEGFGRRIITDPNTGLENLTFEEYKYIRDNPALYDMLKRRGDAARKQENLDRELFQLSPNELRKRLNPEKKSSLEEPKGAWEKFSDYVHDLRVKFSGEPEKWSTKEHMGQLISNAMSVLGAGYRMPRGPGSRSALGEVPASDLKQRLLDLNAQGIKKSAVADELGVSDSTLTKILKQHDIEWNPTSPKSMIEYPHVQEAFKKAMSEGAVTAPEIATKMIEAGVTIEPHSVLDLKRKFGIETKTQTKWTEEQNNTLKQLVSEGNTYSQIAKAMDTTRGAVASRIAAMGLESTSGNLGGGSKSVFTSDIIDKALKMKTEGYSSKEIANELGIKSPASLRNTLTRLERNKPQKVSPESGHRPEGDYPPNASAAKKAEWDTYWKGLREWKDFMGTMNSMKVNEKALDEWIDKGPSSSQIEDRRPGHGGFPPRLPKPDFTSYPSGQLKKDLGFDNLNYTKAPITKKTSKQ